MNFLKWFYVWLVFLLYRTSRALLLLAFGWRWSKTKHGRRWVKQIGVTRYQSIAEEALKMVLIRRELARGLR